MKETYSGLKISLKMEGKLRDISKKPLYERYRLRTKKSETFL